MCHEIKGCYGALLGGVVQSRVIVEAKVCAHPDDCWWWGRGKGERGRMGKRLKGWRRCLEGIWGRMRSGSC